MDPLTIGALGIAGGNAISSAISGGKADQIAEESLRLEKARETDRAMLRAMFMDRITGGATPEQSVYNADTRAADVFGAGDPNAAGRGNPFANPMAAPTGGPCGGFGGWDPTRLDYQRTQADDQINTRGLRQAGDKAFDDLGSTSGASQGREGIPAVVSDYLSKGVAGREALSDAAGAAEGRSGIPLVVRAAQTAQTPPRSLDVAAAASPPPERDARSTGSWLNRILGGNR